MRYLVMTGYFHVVIRGHFEWKRDAEMFCAALRSASMTERILLVDTDAVRYLPLPTEVANASFDVFRAAGLDPFADDEPAAQDAT